MRIKRDLLRVHRWVALVLAPLLFLQALTGGILLFRDELGALIGPVAQDRTGAGGPVPVSVLVASAQDAVPGFTVRRIFLPTHGGDTAFVLMLGGAEETKRYAAIDPGSGRAIATGSVWRFPLEAALQLHYRLLDGRLGMIVVLVNALALTVLSATGLVFWWPGRSRIVSGLAIRAAPARLRLRQWHRSIGVLISAVILFSAVTGAILVLPDLAEPAAPSPVRQSTAPGWQIDRAVVRAQRAFPGARLRDIRFPPADRIDVNFLAPRMGPMAVDVASVSLSQAQLVKRLPAERNFAPWTTYLPLHNGVAFGLPGRLFLLVEALALIVLALTGPWMWWQARRGAKGER